jgi:hypothetical protein
MSVMPAKLFHRREFVKQTAGGIGAAALAGRFAAAGETPGGPAASADTKARISGSFFDLAHVNLWDAAYWTDTCRHWKEENWRALFQDMHGIGIDTAICTSTALWGRPLFGGYEKTVGRPLRFGCEDPLGTCVDEADKLGMKMFFGVGWRGRVSQVRDYADMSPPWPDVWFQWNTALAVALVDRFGGRPSFAGLYIPYEMDFHDHEVELYERFIHKHLRPAVGKVKILASPGNLGVDLPGEKIDELPKIAERTGIDILAPQDYGGRGSIDYARDMASRQAEAIKKVRKPLADIGVALWANCETFGFESSPDGRGYCIAGPIQRIEQQIKVQAPLVEKLICYQYQGIMNKRTELVNIGHPGTDKLYRDYVAYLKKQGE